MKAQTLEQDFVTLSNMQVLLETASLVTNNGRQNKAFFDEYLYSTSGIISSRTSLVSCLGDILKFKASLKH